MQNAHIVVAVCHINIPWLVVGQIMVYPDSVEISDPTEHLTFLNCVCPGYACHATAASIEHNRITHLVSIHLCASFTQKNTTNFSLLLKLNCEAKLFVLDHKK